MSVHVVINGKENGNLPKPLAFTPGFVWLCECSYVAASVYGVNISKLIRNPIACVSCQDLFDRE